MPRPKKVGAPEPKRRSRNGCWPCKGRKVKCGEEKPKCLNCERNGEVCDYSIRLNWGGRTRRQDDDFTMTLRFSPPSNSYSLPFPSAEQFTQHPPPPEPQHRRSDSSTQYLPPQSSENERLDQPTHMLYDTRRGSTPSAAEGSRPISIPIDPRIHAAQDHYSIDYPSPQSWSNLHHTRPDAASPMLPPLRANLAMASPEHRTKRLRLSPFGESPAQSLSTMTRHDGSVDSVTAGHAPPDVPSPFTLPPMTPYSPFMSLPLTPGSSVASEESTARSVPMHLPSSQQSSDSRRLSVNYLLTNSSPTRTNVVDSGPKNMYINYGFDIGQPDLDIPNNKDPEAIIAFSPPAHPETSEETTSAQSTAFEANGYYEKPVRIRIPKELEPLPPLLLESPMNLLYFHHFLNHTARLLVPHDCEENPFRCVLPKMAVRDKDLLSLLLAFSASHRARLLCHTEPSNRIAIWMQDVFPKLRVALESPDPVSDSILTTAIMLASLEIVSPNAFEVPIPWKSHLGTARQLIIARGGLQSLHRGDDESSYFLSRWFAYLDVLGSLSGSKNDSPLGADYLALSPNDALPGDLNADDQIDCLLGFTNRFVGTLARIASLAKQCEHQRIDPHGHVRSEWRPSADVVAAAEVLRTELRNGCEKVVYKACTHGDSRSNMNPAAASISARKADAWDLEEIQATNSAFHWAGMLHLLRRVLGCHSAHGEVRHAVEQTLAALRKVRRGSTAEACLLFPIFSVGVEVETEEDRKVVRERMLAMEKIGLGQVGRARRVLDRVWEGGNRAWEGFVGDEFFG
ncbi:fungal-specific transcription factor domain-containing protein [Phyllosticta citribraziliensis]|uniref:Fungal-specific transcription factor domain-containing protein n=1 Tax=Phyllosticta citribraziliensis TaxID=989973 RepID=A0ABR1M6H4_9PEZI